MPKIKTVNTNANANANVIFTRETSLVVIRDALECVNNYCEDIQNYFLNYENMTYGEAIDDFVANNGIDNKMTGRIIVNLSVLSDRNTMEINNDLIYSLLVNRTINHMQTLFLWRKIKNFTNISDGLKQAVIAEVKGELPNAEKVDDWSFTKEDGTYYDDLSSEVSE